jgi:hypothetical protein
MADGGWRKNQLCNLFDFAVRAMATNKYGDKLVGFRSVVPWVSVGVWLLPPSSIRHPPSS